MILRVAASAAVAASTAAACSLDGAWHYHDEQYTLKMAKPGATSGALTATVVPGHAGACTWCTAHGTLGADGSVEMHYDNGDSNTGTLSKDCKSLSWGWEAGTGTGAPVEPDAAAAPCKPGHHSGGRPSPPPPAAHPEIKVPLPLPIPLAPAPAPTPPPHSPPPIRGLSAAGAGWAGRPRDQLVPPGHRLRGQLAGHHQPLLRPPLPPRGGGGQAVPQRRPQGAPPVSARHTMNPVPFRRFSALTVGGRKRLNFMFQSWVVNMYLDCPTGLGLHCPNATQIGAPTRSSHQHASLVLHLSFRTISRWCGAAARPTPHCPHASLALPESTRPGAFVSSRSPLALHHSFRAISRCCPRCSAEQTVAGVAISDVRGRGPRW